LQQQHEDNAPFVNADAEGQSLDSQQTNGIVNCHDSNQPLALTYPKSGAAAGGEQSDAQQFPLPATATSEKLPRNAARVAIEKQLLDFAESLGCQLDAATATGIVAKWPFAGLSDGELVKLLTKDYRQIPLNRAIDTPMARSMVSQNADALRWLLCTWLGYDESRPEYYTTRHGQKYTPTGVFVTAWRVRRNPPDNWLISLVEGMESQKRDIAATREKREAYGFKRSLDAGQRERLHREVLDTIKDRLGRFHGANSPEYEVVEIELLNDPETRDWLLSPEYAPKAGPVTDTPESTNMPQMAAEAPQTPQSEHDEPEDEPEEEWPEFSGQTIFETSVATLTQAVWDGAVKYKDLFADTTAARALLGNDIDAALLEMVLDEVRSQLAKAA
jgi:hypothetical protein